MTTVADSRPSNRWLFVAMAVLLTASVGIQAVRDRGWEPYQPQHPILWLQSGPLVKRLALGFDSLVADVYWMRAVVYYGERRRDDEATRNFDLLHPLLDLVTSVDPHFQVAYRFGSIFLTEAYPNGPGRPDQAIALLKRAIEADRSRWEYMHDIGFIYYWWANDYEAAAQWFDRASQQPDAPAWLRPLAATTLARGGDRASSRLLWNQILATTDIDWLKQSAQLRLTQLNAMDTLDQLNAISDRFTARVGHPPSGWPELAASEGLRGIPLDSTGEPFTLDAATGHITIGRRSKLWPLPTENQMPPDPSR